ncbi:Structural maintenance of chromosomes protein 4 [Mycena venus]|uniref:Structural maintenance of chromosomes protein n=1 Tax=Mycena venus TaxID=2733690 RepID=A0A8H6YN02_9AGAR|nr:Structural maintenance of chromosomes protein 4 [Mycena venus]
MPPRRSSRSTRASLEPQPEPIPTKRKREDPHEKENLSKTKSRSKAKALQEIPESDVDNEEDQEDSPPPVKKSRPSLDPESDEEEPAPKSRKALGKGRAARKEVEEERPTRKGKRAVSSKSMAESSGEEEDADSDDDGAKPKTKRAAPKSRRAVPISDDEDSDQAMSDFEDEKPAKKAKGKRASTAKSKPKAAPAKSKSRASVAPSQPDAEEASVPPTATTAPIQEEDEEEEGPLIFNPPPMPTASQMAQAAVEEPTGPKSRLVIHKLALVNFKSYAGRQEIGPFHKSFSAIVGPNGSGKSNTIDALLFVFGYRASKMRQGKLSELIHNSARFLDLDECSVEVHFREIVDLPGPDAFEVVPDSQLVVTRTAFKNNSSRYTINRRTSTFTEVQTLLKGRGIDLDHKRFLILQGEVESIAQMKPKGSTEHEDGLLEYLEDIIGTSSYVEPISASLAQIEVLQEERASKMQRLRIVEKEKNALEEKKREAEGYLKLKNEKVRAENRLWQWYLWKSFVAEEESLRNVDLYKKELADEQERNKDDVTHVELLRKDYEEREKTYQEVQDAAAAAVQELAHHEKQEVELKEKRKHVSAKAKKLKKSVTEDTSAHTKAQRTIEDSVEKIDKEKGKEKILEGIRDSLKDKTQVFHDQIEVKQKELQPWTGKINAKKAEVDVATSEREALAKKAKAAQDAIEEASNTLEHLQADQKTKLAQQENHRSDKKAQQAAIAKVEKQYKDAQDELQECRTKASSSRQKVAEARNSLAEKTSQNKVVDGLTRFKNAGRITGFYGRLGSLGTIPDKYDVAISTACPGLHHMVVDKVEQAQSCIQHLRDQNLGRATFTVLEKLRGEGMEKIPTPENVPRLFDLVQPKEERFSKAFFKALGNTLVANDMDQANRIAFGARRWRVVTLAGQLIETTGAMSGGGNQPARGAMSSKFAPEAVRPEVLRELEQEAADDEKRLDKATKEAQAAETELDRLKRAVPETETAFQKLGLDIENGKRRISEAEKRISDLKSQNKPNTGDVARVAKLDGEIRQSEAELEELQEKASKIERAIQELEKKILEIGGSKLLTQKSKVDGIRLHINLANDEITKAEVAKAKADKDLVKLAKAIKTNTAAMEEVDQELEELNDQINELTAFIAGHQANVQEAKAAAESSKDDLEARKESLDKKEEEIQAFKQKEMELEQKLAEANRIAKENTASVEHWRDELETLTLEEIDDDDEDDNDDEDNATEQPADAMDATAQTDEVKAEDQEQAPKQPRARTPSSGLHTYSADELSKLKKREMIADVELLDEKLKKMKPNLEVLSEYKEREKQFFERAKDLEMTTKQRDAEKQKYDGLRKRRLDEFMAGFSLISLKLKEMYQMITLGGNAELELVDSMDPFSEGIIFSVMPPKKSWKNISNLSGGEKTLSSLALVFALHVFKPTPLYFMDEIDAALDFRNVSIVANYIKDRTKNAQFIIISLRNDMFELSHRLIGIYKTANATQSISIDNHALQSSIPVRA